MNFQHGKFDALKFDALKMYTKKSKNKVEPKGMM